jgi:TPR repeat protein
MKYFIASLILCYFTSNSFAKEFTDEYECKKKNVVACLNMALRDLGGKDGKKLLREIIKAPTENSNASSANRKAVLIAAALEYGNTVSNKDFILILESGCNQDKDPLLCFARFSTLSRPGNNNIEKAASKIWITRGITILDGTCKNNNAFACFLQASFQPFADENKLDDSFLLFKKACQLAEPAACLMLGSDKLAKGEKEEGFELLRKACDVNYSQACFALSVYLNRDGKSTEAIKLAKLKCKSEVAKSCSLAAILLDKVDNTNVEIEQLIIQGCDLGNFDGCEDYGTRVLKKGNVARAKEYYGRACSNGQADSCFQKAKIEETLGNKKEANKLYEDACTKRSASGCIQIGMAKLLSNLASKKSKKVAVKAASLFLKKSHEILNEECSDGENESCEKLKNLVQIEAKYGLNIAD